MPDDVPPQTPTAAPRGLRQHWPLLVLLVATFACFTPLLDVAFSWDDEALIVDNQLIKVLDEGGTWGDVIHGAFTRDLWSTTRLPTLKSGYYRPLMLLSLGLDRSLAGLSSAAAHFHSLLWHLLAVGMLYGLAHRLLGRAGAALAATLFALHPVQSEVLALVAARNDSMAAALVLGALWLLVERAPSAARIIGAATLALLALLSKESAVLALFMLFALDLARFRRPVGWPRYAALAASLLAYVPLRRIADLDAAIAPTESSLRLVSSQALQIAGSYAQILVWPWPLTPARHVHYLPEIGDTLQGLVLLGAALALAVWKGRDRPLVLVGLAWAAAAFAPSLAATFDKGLLGERYLYFPMAGLGLAVAAALPRIPTWAPAVVAVPAILALQARLPHWQDSRTVWEHAHDVAPTAFTAGGLAWYYHRDKDYPRANALFIQALEGEPPYRDVCEMVVMSHLEAKEAAEAVRVGKWALTERGCPADGMLLNHYAIALGGLGRFAEAAQVASNHPRGLHGPGLVVVGAHRAVTGDLQTLYAAAARMAKDDPTYLDRVAKTLRLGGQPEVSQRGLALKQGPPAAADAAPAAPAPTPFIPQGVAPPDASAPVGGTD